MRDVTELSRGRRTGGRRTNGIPHGGVTDYTLAKRAVVAQFRRGVLNRFDVCDAHPELMRAAKNIGRSMDRPCPICDGSRLRQVSYVFGDQLKDLSGRVVYPETWVMELVGSYDEFRCYSVEVCVDCSWNHLSACYLLGRKFAG
ncbi:MAG: DUF5318 family protein [Actinomycetota bacterium]